MVTASRKHVIFYTGIYTLRPDENPLTAKYLNFENSGSKPPRSAKIIPLCELYSIKRDGRYKLRQIALGNLLRQGRLGSPGHFYNTWSTTISGSGIRLFAAIACALNQQVSEYDVETAYLQGSRTSELYAYAPSHYGFSELPIEDLASLRLELLDWMQEHGEDGVKWLCRRMSDTKSAASVLKLNVPIYGEPNP